MLDRIPAGKRYYLTLDIDAFDPSIAAGTGTPSHGGFHYYEVLELIDGIARRGSVVGIDLVEVAPDYDPSGSTTILAAQILMNAIGRILHTGAEGAASGFVTLPAAGGQMILGQEAGLVFHLAGALDPVAEIDVGSPRSLARWM